MKNGTLKQYLIELGWKIDKKTESEMKTALSKMDSRIIKSAGKLSLMGASAMNLTQSIFRTDAAILKIASSAAKSDLEVERFARKMFSSVASARSMTQALEAMGITMEDLPYLTPEEITRFKELRKEAAGFHLPGDYGDTMKSYREAASQLTRLKMNLGNFKNMLGYAIIKQSGATIEEWRRKLKSLNDYLVQVVPKITEKIAKFFDVFIRLGNGAFTGLKLIKDLLKDVWGSLNDGQKKILGFGAIIGGFLSLFTLGPIGAFIAALMVLFLLLDDFATYKRGGDSVIGDFLEDMKNWKLPDWMVRFGEWIDRVADRVSEILQGLRQIGKQQGDAWAQDAIDQWGNASGVWNPKDNTFGALLRGSTNYNQSNQVTIHIANGDPATVKSAVIDGLGAVSDSMEKVRLRLWTGGVK